MSRENSACRIRTKNKNESGLENERSINAKGESDVKGRAALK